MVITTKEQLEALHTRLENERVFVHVIASSRYAHPSISSVSSKLTPISTFHFLFEDGTYMCFAQVHPDAPQLGIVISLENAKCLLAVDKKDLIQMTDAQEENVMDMSTMFTLNGEDIPQIEKFYPQIISVLFGAYQMPRLTDAIPLVKWMEVGESYLRELKSLYECLPTPQGYEFINNVIIPTLAEIERAGIYVRDGHYAYTKYNIHTSTGRPSNSFGGTNYAALNKHDGTREKYVSRFGENGMLVQFDYEAFHLRLAAHRIGFTLPETSVHTFLAEQYYGTSEITPEMYEESKARTFAIMYGQTDDTGGVAFFDELKRYSSDLWELFRQGGFVLSGRGRQVVVPDPNPSKVFNYLMQLMETEEALLRVRNILHLLDGYKAKVVLYTYDAILLDVPNDELDLMPTVRKLLNVGGYPVREYRGENYNNLILHKI